MRFKGNKAAQDDIPAWQSIYCSLILIMLVLFAMLASYSVTDQKKMMALKSNFSPLPDRQVSQGKRQVIAASMPGEKASESLWAEKAVRQFQQAGAKFRLADDILLERFPGGLHLKLKSDVLFAPGQAVIDREIFPYLDEVIKIAGERDLNLTIEGHTDDEPVHNAAFPSNWELSASRAMNVLRYCLERGKLPAGRLSAAGFGSYHPLVPNDTPLGRSRNRRIEIYLTKGA